MLNLPLSGNHSIFLLGPRGTGKSTWIKKHLPNALYFDLLDFNIANPLRKRPSKLDSMIPANFDNWVVLDEVQRIPELLNQVHRLIENRKIRFLLTGSSTRSLRKKGVNLLAGRALNYYMHPLIIQEIGDDFNLEKVLQYGLLPTAITSPDPYTYLGSYIDNYIREEILLERIARNEDSFSNFLEVASFSQGSVLNMSEIGRELSFNRATVGHYFDILEDLLLATRLNPFTKRAKRKLISHQKFYFFDTGVYRLLKKQGPFGSNREADGAGLETLFLQSFQAVNDYLELRYNIYFWRTQQGKEVDFVAYGPHGIHAFEIKRSDRVTPATLKSLKTFKQDYPEAQLYLLYGGDYTYYEDNVTIIPFTQALKELPEILKSKETTIPYL